MDTSYYYAAAAVERHLTFFYVGLCLIFHVHRTVKKEATKLQLTVVVVVVSHIQRIGCQPEKTTLLLLLLLFLTFSVLVANPKKLLYTVANPARGLLNREKRTQEKVWQHTPPPTPHTARSEKINKITRRIYRRYAGGRSRVRTRIPSARRLGLWVWLRNSTLPSLHGGQSRSWSAEQGKENKRKRLAAYPPTPHTARSEKINKITRRIYRRYAGGRSRVRTRIPSARRLGLWVWLRKILHSRLR